MEPLFVKDVKDLVVPPFKTRIPKTQRTPAVSAAQDNSARPTKLFLCAEFANDEPVHYLRSRYVPAKHPGCGQDYLNLLRQLYGAEVEWDTPLQFYPFGTNWYNHISCVMTLKKKNTKGKFTRRFVDKFTRTFEYSAVDTNHVRHRQDQHFTGQLVKSVVNRFRLLRVLCLHLHFVATQAFYARKDDAAEPRKSYEPPWMVRVPCAPTQAEINGAEKWTTLLKAGHCTPRQLFDMHNAPTYVDGHFMPAGALLMAAADVYQIGSVDEDEDEEDTKEVHMLFKPTASHKRVIEAGLMLVSPLDKRGKMRDRAECKSSYKGRSAAGDSLVVPTCLVKSKHTTDAGRYNFYYWPELQPYFLPLLWAHDPWGLLAGIHLFAEELGGRSCVARFMEADARYNSVGKAANAMDFYPTRSNAEKMQAFLLEDSVPSPYSAQENKGKKRQRDQQQPTSPRKRRKTWSELERDMELEQKGAVAEEEEEEEEKIGAAKGYGRTSQNVHYYGGFRSQLKQNAYSMVSPAVVLQMPDGQVFQPSGVLTSALGQARNMRTTANMARVTSCREYVFDQAAHPFFSVFVRNPMVPLSPTTLALLLHRRTTEMEDKKASDSDTGADADAGAVVAELDVLTTLRPLSTKFQLKFLRRDANIPLEPEEVEVCKAKDEMWLKHHTIHLLPAQEWVHRAGDDVVTSGPELRDMNNNDLIRSGALLSAAFRRWLPTIKRATVNGTGFPADTPVRQMVFDHGFVPRLDWKTVAKLVKTSDSADAKLQSDMESLWRLSLGEGRAPGPRTLLTYFELYCVAADAGWTPRRTLRALYHLFCMEVRGNRCLDRAQCQCAGLPEGASYDLSIDCWAVGVPCMLLEKECKCVKRCNTTRVPQFDEVPWMYDCLLEVLALQSRFTIYALEHFFQSKSLFASFSDHACFTDAALARLFDLSTYGEQEAEKWPAVEWTDAQRTQAVKDFYSMASGRPELVALREAASALAGDFAFRSAYRLVQLYEKHIRLPLSQQVADPMEAEVERRHRLEPYAESHFNFLKREMGEEWMQHMTAMLLRPEAPVIVTEDSDDDDNITEEEE